uniref:eRF1 domain-containing protein n=1 Tax=Aplanochytrium stocchinoi TaxID=215587 RepID=A0A7S3PPM2_9STRA
MARAQREDIKVILKNKSMFILAHSSSGYKHDLDEVLKDPGIQSRLADTSALKEVNALNKFLMMLNNNSEKAFYSYNHVKAALDQGAIRTLLITDSLFRSNNIQTRKKYVSLVEDCREAGAEVMIFSALHVSGKQLEQMSGVAAILRFPVPEIEEIELNDEEFSRNKEQYEEVNDGGENLEQEDTEVYF